MNNSCYAVVQNNKFIFQCAVISLRPRTEKSHVSGIIKKGFNKVDFVDKIGIGADTSGGETKLCLESRCLLEK